MAFTKFFTLSLMLHGGRTIFCGSTSGSFAVFFCSERNFLWWGHSVTAYWLLVAWCPHSHKKQQYFFITKLPAEYRSYETEVTNLPAVFVMYVIEQKFHIFLFLLYVHDLSIRFNSKLFPLWRAATFVLSFKESVNSCQSSGLCWFCSAIHQFIHTCSKIYSWKSFLQVLFAFAQEQSCWCFSSFTYGMWN